MYVHVIVMPISLCVSICTTQINAVANKAAGEGYESTDNYSNLIYEFYNIHNIHIMRESLQKLVEGTFHHRLWDKICAFIAALLLNFTPATCSPSQSVSGFLTGLESSGWLRHIQLILECSIFAAKVRERKRVSIYYL